MKFDQNSYLIKQKYSSYTWIPGGGHSKEGLEAYSDYFSSIIKNNKYYFRQIKKVICPFGTGTTALGILDGI